MPIVSFILRPHACRRYATGSVPYLESRVGAYVHVAFVTSHARHIVAAMVHSAVIHAAVVHTCVVHVCVCHDAAVKGFRAVVEVFSS
jgi:hypothetical protein